MVARYMEAQLLSHAWRLQLFYWGIAGNVMFWCLTWRLLSVMLVSLRKLTYRFLWDGKHENKWVQVALPKNEGGLGYIQVVRGHNHNFSDEEGMEDLNDRWMRERYVKAREGHSRIFRGTVE